MPPKTELLLELDDAKFDALFKGHGELGIGAALEDRFPWMKTAPQYVANDDKGLLRDDQFSAVSGEAFTLQGYTTPILDRLAM